MLEFIWPWVFLLLPLPLLTYLFLPAVIQEDAALRTPYFDQLTKINGENIAHYNPLKTKLNLVNLLAIIAWIFLIIAASKPQWIGNSVELPTSGRDLMLAVDISGSMKMDDLQLNGEQVTRLEVVKNVVSDFVAQRKGDRIGLILFGTQAYLQAPLTFDRKTVKTLLEESQIGFAGEKTAIGDAIGLAIKRLRKRPENSRLLILLTDGANTAGEIDPLKSAELAAQASIKIHTIGVGANEMITPGLFGSDFGARRINPSADLDEGMLKNIAKTTSGQYFRAHSTDQLKQIYVLLDKIEPVAQENETFRPKRSLFMWPLGLALLLTLLVTLIKLYPILRRYFSNLAVSRSDNQKQGRRRV